MGFRHVVCLTFADECDRAEQERLADAVRGLEDSVPTVRGYCVGLDAGISQGNASMAIVADFDDVAGYEVYRDHPAHRVVIEQLLPHLAARAAVQHDT